MKSNKQMDAISNLAIVKVADTQEITYGTVQEVFPINDVGGTVSIDRAFLAGQSTFRLKHISTCLSLAGKEMNEANKAWFNRQVRDPYHKALRFLNRQFMTIGKPVSIGLSKRVSKRKSDEGTVTVTAKFGYEYVRKPATVAGQVADKVAGADKATKQSAKRAKRAAQSSTAVEKTGIVSVETALDRATATVETAQ